MISATSSVSQYANLQQTAQAQLPTVQNDDPSSINEGGRKVGHQARAAVDAAREAGADLPKNAQGKAASIIARGADAASIFAAQVEEAETAAAVSGGDDAPILGDGALSGGTVGADAPPPPPPPPAEETIETDATAAGAATEAGDDITLDLLATLYTSQAIAPAGAGSTSAEVALDLLA